MYCSIKGTILALFILLAFCEAASPLYYCKCVCGKATTILELSQPSTPSKPCAECNKQFCIDRLPDECNPSLKSSDSEVVITTECFKRESTKDEIIVVTFLILTGGLLLYATIIKGILDKRRGDADQYNALPSNGAG